MKLLCIVVFLATMAFGQQEPSLEQANQLLNQSKWNEAEAAFAKLAIQTPENGAVWVGLGEARLQSKDYSGAEKAFQKAVDLKFRPAFNKGNLARVAAARGDKAAVLEILRGLAASGLSGFARAFVGGSSEFESLQSDPDFRKLMEEMKPCRDAVYHQFDFWIGKWNVSLPNGQLAGVNEVTQEQDGCLLVEHWKANGGVQTGSSFNYYDTRDKKWHQLYIDNSGNAGAFPELSGGLVDGKMVMLTDPKQSPLNRWSWYTLPGGKVRQMAEQSTDDGKTWSITWDSVYEKVNP